MSLSDGYAVMPEQSTVAIVAHHPQAVYFGMKSGFIPKKRAPDELIAGHRARRRAAARVGAGRSSGVAVPRGPARRARSASGRRPALRLPAPRREFLGPAASDRAGPEGASGAAPGARGYLARVS